MTRSLSSAALRSIFAANADDPWLAFVTINHADLAQPIRVVHNSQDVVSNGETYIAFPFGAEFPVDDANQVTSVQLVIHNVGRDITQALEAIGTPPEVTLKFCLGSQPDTVEAGPFEFTLQGATYDAHTITGTLGYPPLLMTTFPAGDINPADFPGAFAA